MPSTCQCLPHPTGDLVCEMTDSSVSRVAASIESILETLNQVVSMQKEMQKQMASDRSMEKDNSDASEKFLLQQTFKNFLNEDLPAIIEKTLKRELATFGQTVEERFQKVVANIISKLEAVVARQIQAQYQILQLEVPPDPTQELTRLIAETMDEKAFMSILQMSDVNKREALKLRLEASVVPEFEKSYSNSTMLELYIFMAERKYEEAFTSALMMEDVNIVSWLCAQVDLPTILLANPPPLSQVVLLNLLKNLACDISKETPRKLTWMWCVFRLISPSDPAIPRDSRRKALRQVHEKLYRQSRDTMISSEVEYMNLIMHAITAMLKR